MFAPVMLKLALAASSLFCEFIVFPWHGLKLNWTIFDQFEKLEGQTHAEPMVA